MSPVPPVCVVIDAGCAVAQSLAIPLARSGNTVGLVTDKPVAESEGVAVIACGFESRERVADAVERVVRRCGMPHLFVLSMIPASLLKTTLIQELERRVWTDDLHASTLATLYVLQCCHGVLRDRGGTIVVLGPALSLVGAAGSAALCTLLEAQRALVKSAARQWGRFKLRLHWVSLGVDSNCFRDLDPTCIPQGPELGPPPPALGRVPDMGTDIAALVAFLGSSGAGALTGTTMVADGGNWMVP